MFIRRTRIKKYLLRCIVCLLVILLIVYFAKSLNQLSNDIRKESLSLKLTSNEEIFEKVLNDYESRIIPNLGNLGEAAHLEGKDKEDGEKALKKVALNTVLSDRIPLNRTLRDPRHSK